MLKKSLSDASRTALIASAVVALAVVPSAMVCAALVRLFQNESFHFMGLNLDVTVAAHTGGVTLTIDQIALGAFLFIVFAVVFALTFVTVKVMCSRHQDK